MAFLQINVPVNAARDQRVRRRGVIWFLSDAVTHDACVV
jgi:hypothetical protein